MIIPEPVGEQQSIYQSRLFEVYKQPHKIGEKVIDFEYVRRPPGTRLLIVRDGKILMTREYRAELKGHDYRLPGGKVFDSFDEYKKALANDADMIEAGKQAAKREALEEVGIEPNTLKHLYTTTPAATVQWDLYYYLIDDFQEADGGQQLEEGEVIEPEWKTFEEVKQLCLNNEVSEERTVAVLLKYILKK